MLDGMMRKVIDAPLNRAGRWLAGRGVTADAVTLAGLGFGLIAAALLAFGAAGALVALPLMVGRIADGLDGAVARARGNTDFGGFLDITCDFAFYGAIPLAFALRDPAANAVLMEIGAANARYALRYWMNNPRADDPTDSDVRMHAVAALARVSAAGGPRRARRAQSRSSRRAREQFERAW